MKKCLIGLGGIGCSIVKQYYENYFNEDVLVICINTEDLEDLSEKRMKGYVIQDYHKNGTGISRNIGREFFRRAVYRYEISEFFDDDFF